MIDFYGENRNQYILERLQNFLVHMKIDLNEVEFIGETNVTVRGSRRRTTVPKQIVDKLEIKDKDRLRWILFRDGTILVVKVKEVG